MRFKYVEMLFASLILFTCVSVPKILHAQGTVSTFHTSVGDSVYTFAGSPPSEGGVTAIPTILVPIKLIFESNGAALRGASVSSVLDSRRDLVDVLASPLFTPAHFPVGGSTQYGDAMLRATFPKNIQWHTLLGHPKVHPVTITVPVGNGYILQGKRQGELLAVADADYIQGELFRQLGPQSGKLVIAVTHDTTFYAAGDATICCAWGTHGIDASSGTSFVLASYLRNAPTIVEDKDVQPLSVQLAQFLKDPLHNPQRYGYNVTAPGNSVPAWQWPGGSRPGLSCGDTGLASAYFLLEPTDTNPKNNIPKSVPFVVRTKRRSYHLQNVALLPWYLGSTVAGGMTSLGKDLSFPDVAALSGPALPCGHEQASSEIVIQSSFTARQPGLPLHDLIGYWTGNGGVNQTFALSDVPPQWDVVIVAFAGQAPNQPEGTISFSVPRHIDAASFKRDIGLLHIQGRKVMLSLGGGGAFFHFDDPAGVPRFVHSVAAIVQEYGFDGIDIDFESPSLLLTPGDIDYKHPTTPSIVHLISALRELHDRFGKSFMLSLVPEGPQMTAGYMVYGGQFGSYLPIVHALREILTFVDVQDYNTPPMQALDGEIVQSHTVDYHLALTELELRGFAVGGNSKLKFAPLPASKVAVGFLTDYDEPSLVTEAMETLLTGKNSPGQHHLLHRPAGNPSLRGAMFWTIDDDRLQSSRYSLGVSPLLHPKQPE